MNLISKVCVVFLAWTIGGYCIWMGMLDWYGLKALKKYHKTVPDSMTKFYDLTAEVLSGGFARETYNAVKGSVYANRFVRYFRLSVEWPTWVAKLKPALDTAYTMMEEKYGTDCWKELS